ncbi:Hypothetical_protein [Hexamita inflata]|uniref:Hypothetical_protein n=1 Tax=Hexamita inflata TaxID=28002 RepID=A0AA86R913_9EUKA|nr:Hypothetical protein HINF_LOCUS58183 [Hexamita inflata]
MWQFFIFHQQQQRSISSKNIVRIPKFILLLKSTFFKKYHSSIIVEYWLTILGNEVEFWVNLQSRNCTVLKQRQLQHSCTQLLRIPALESFNVPNFNEDVQEALQVTAFWLLDQQQLNFLIVHHSPFTCTTWEVSNHRTFKLQDIHLISLTQDIGIKVTRSQSPSLWHSDSIEAEFLVGKHSGERVTLLH